MIWRPGIRWSYTGDFHVTNVLCDTSAIKPYFGGIFKPLLQTVETVYRQ